MVTDSSSVHWKNAKGATFVTFAGIEMLLTFDPENAPGAMVVTEERRVTAAGLAGLL